MKDYGPYINRSCVNLSSIPAANHVDDVMSELPEFRSIESTHVGKAEIFWGPNFADGKPAKGQKVIHKGSIKTVKHSEYFIRGREPKKGDYCGISFYHSGEVEW